VVWFIGSGLSRSGMPRASSATIVFVMKKPSRRNFLRTVSASALITAAVPALTKQLFAAPQHQRVFIGSSTPKGIFAYDWDSAAGELMLVGDAARLANVDWIIDSLDHKYLFAASEVDSFNGKPTGEVASFCLENGKLLPVSARNSAGVGTCHVALDRTGRVLVAADYAGGSAASFLVTGGKLSHAIWTEFYTGHGPNIDRQQSAHAHFASFSPDNRFVYINDLGEDCIHIYRLNTATAMLTPAGTYHAKPGCGPRTLRFHPNGHVAYSINELDSTVDVLMWSKANGGLTLVKRIDLLPAGYSGDTHGCDTVISRDGKSVYFANRGNNSIYFFHADAKTGSLMLGSRFDCGGKTPRSFVLDPTERWMLVANQNSNQISVFARDAATGFLAEKGKNFSVVTPMCILFV
jgi:6-phosphogluconolactonase